ncbi:hypothetical protein [Rhodopila globiformis]|uniref:Uncharacterized protein n=1 Tax=Rhodopila globiformis TaxID=1071 RepID=A0A2S6MW74_RHOGL|nr:hypothetical protein [Rhodopila globiformis]PPQ26614.1 hypothetical protein CCS01_30130 [Rhodopila globiformis]
MIWINPVTGSHDIWHIFFQALRRAAKCADSLARQPEFVRFDDNATGLIRCGAWQSPCGLPYGDVAPQ